MNLDELAIEMSRLPAITDAERNGFAKLLSEVKRNVKIRPTLNGGSVRHMEPGTIRVNLPPEGRPTLSTTPRSLTWLSMPYFSIEKYAGLLSAGTPSSFPLETLLQSEYSRTTQEREEQQVVWQTNQPKEAHCFHVAQVWCIVLDNSLLLTCGRMSGAALRRDLITVAPGSFGEVGVQSKALYVSYYDSVLLELPLTSCLTWFEFSIQFHEFWPQAVSFYHHDRLLTAKDWPRIVNLAQHSNTRITLDLRLGEHPPPFTEGILRPLNPGAEEHDEAEETADHGSDPLNATTETPDLGPMLSCSVNDRFHVFSWMDTVQMKENPQVLNQKALRKQLEDAEQYIMNYAELKDRRSYRNCPRSSRRKVHDYLNEQRIRVETAQDLSHKDLDFEEKVALYNMCDILYDFFLPPNVDDELPMSGSFWGAVQEIVKMSQSRKDGSEADDDDRNASSRHERRSRQRPRVLQRIQSFQSIMSNAPTTARTRVAVPDSLVRAWLHLILALVQSTSNKETSDENHIYVADALIKKGLGEIMDNLPTGDLLRHFVVQPMDIVALLSEKLIRDSTGQYPNISDTYSEYLKKLGNEIMTKTANRTNQLHFPLFRQEIDIIKHIIDTQKTIVGSMRNPVHSSGDATRKEKMMLALEHEKSMKKYQKAPSYSHHHQPNYHSYSRPYGRTSRIMELTTDYDNSPEDFAKMSATDPGGFLEVFRWTCDAWLERRRAEFDEFADEARRLETMNANKVEATKDRQEAAVYAFTMVTIVFLPLSTISSIFGMNSRDVRDMAAGQWLYWAVALPTTAAVIVAGLAWMGELRPVVDWLLLRRRRRRSAAAGPPQYYWWPPPPPARNPNPDPFAPALPPYPPPAALPPYALPARYTARSYY
ncbi:hypothetical protein F4780DRAFT_777811 [Xylariomycetidae sp. FL0641]|nr:hypothetical protein F4780DRAFT_777811 [Xylariomycetidae sp. FL0641]